MPDKKVQYIDSLTDKLRVTRSDLCRMLGVGTTMISYYVKGERKPASSTVRASVMLDLLQDHGLVEAYLDKCDELGLETELKGLTYGNRRK
ncbi:helix-turn-helix domain-containing protein [Parendozoicomonas haliclonae]|uniref:Uncharacterized protein n=1 Tax=Parendozoicomonas haliclonae TaxID=1960125 RepID=A0A1X7AK16_9GAMM|nr:helix-turn-helix transcriptional regulator [Parendozoicomonas haliclonae]SMA47380.1 hypothetical protein EHSB41UT_02394 [Parendozoicomonas haliclonae]